MLMKIKFILQRGEHMSNINYSIVGFGGIARTHAIGSYAANLMFKLPFNLNLSNVVTRKPIECNVPGSIGTTSIEEVLSNPNIHFIDICTPNASHRDNIFDVLKANKAIYCEKPLAESYASALEIDKAVKESKVENAVALIYRFVPAVRLIKEEIEKKSIGDIIDFKIKLYHKSYLNENKKTSWRTGAASGGGALLDLGVHLIDIIHFTLGDIEEVSCNNRIFFKDRTSVDEISECKFKLNNNASGTLEVSRIFADMKEETMYEIYGTKGSIKMNCSNPYIIELYSFEDNSIRIKSKVSEKYAFDFYPGERSSLGYLQDCHMASIINFANELFTGVGNTITARVEDALKAQRVIEAAYLSDREGKPVKVFDIV